MTTRVDDTCEMIAQLTSRATFLNGRRGVRVFPELDSETENTPEHPGKEGTVTRRGEWPSYAQSRCHLEPIYTLKTELPERLVKRRDRVDDGEAGGDRVDDVLGRDQ